MASITGPACVKHCLVLSWVVSEGTVTMNVQLRAEKGAQVLRGMLRISQLSLQH